jgi:hypothetical protein
MSISGVIISQHELQEIFELEREVAQKQKRIDELKTGVKALLLAKMQVELGRFDAHLIRRIARHIPWKQAVAENLGLDFIERFRKRFPSSVFFEVMVEEHAVLPLWKKGDSTTESQN